MTDPQLNISGLNVFDEFFLDRQNSLTFTNLSFKISKEPGPMILFVETYSYVCSGWEVDDYRLSQYLYNVSGEDFVYLIMPWHGLFFARFRIYVKVVSLPMSQENTSD